MLEFGAELSDIYAEVYELELQREKKNLKKLNQLAMKSIQNGSVFTDIIYKKDDPEEKFEYIQTMLNLELNTGSKLTKYITADPRERVLLTKQALDRYKLIHAYIKEYMAYKKFSSLDQVESD